MEIPIQNIYYLLCYAWNKLEEQEVVNVEAENFKDIYDLFGKVLSNGCSYLLKKGFDRNYVPHDEIINGIKGKLLFADSLKHNLFDKGKANCEFDDFSHNIIHNQIIKATIRNLLVDQVLSGKIKSELHHIHNKFHGIDDIKLSRLHFNNIRLHRNNYFYDLLIKICRIIYDNLLITETTGNYKFMDFIREPRKMNQVFEKFVFNFYRKHYPAFRIKSDTIIWKLKAETENGKILLPQMTTDISIHQPGRILIIDTKFYKETLAYNFEKPIFHPNNLFQIFAYIENYESKENKVDGMLLYPVVNKEINEVYTYKDHKVMIRTINLQQDWQLIDKRLKELIQ